MEQTLVFQEVQEPLVFQALAHQLLCRRRRLSPRTNKIQVAFGIWQLITKESDPPFLKLRRTNHALNSIPNPFSHPGQPAHLKSVKRSKCLQDCCVYTDRAQTSVLQPENSSPKAANFQYPVRRFVHELRINNQEAMDSRDLRDGGTYQVQWDPGSTGHWSQRSTGTASPLTAGETGSVDTNGF